jgi:hypothetical protein
MKLQKSVGPSRIKLTTRHTHIVEGIYVVHFPHNEKMTQVSYGFYVPSVTKYMILVISITNKSCHVFGNRQCWIISSKDPTKVVVIKNV